MSDFAAKIPFFILGTGRCGSTYLCRLLGIHEQVAMTNEAGVLDFLFFCSRLASVSNVESMNYHRQQAHRLPGFVLEKYNKPFSKIFDQHVPAMLEEFYTSQYPNREFTHWGDKLPDPLAVYALREILPQTKIIMLVRDPRDVASSWIAYSKRPHILRDHPHLAKISAKQWADSWQITYQNIKDRLRPGYQLRYEDLVRDPIVTTAAVFESLGLKLEDRHITQMNEHDSFHWHGTSATVTETIRRWQNDLKESEIAEIESECGDLMQDFGYELSS